MMFVRFIEGAEDGPIIYDTKMQAVPKVEETITLRLKTREELHYRVVSVNYLLDVPSDDHHVTEDLTGVHVIVKKINVG